MTKIYILILAGLFGLRLLNINQSLWLDEGTTAHVAQSLSFWEIIPKFSTGDFHPPLYYFVVKVFGEVFGYTDFVVRLPSLLACLIATLFVYKLGGKWASILFLANPLIFYYSQEARMYMMATALLLATWYCVFINNKIANLFAALSLFTFYGSGFFLAGLLLIYSKKWQYILPGAVLAIIILLPLLQEQVANSRIQLVEIKNWSLVLGKNEAKNFLLIPLKFFTGRVSFYPKIGYFLIGGLWSIGIFCLGLRKANWRLFFVPVVIAGIISFWAPMMQYFRFLYLIPVLCLGMARYSKNIKLIILIGSIAWCLFYIFDKNQWREDWKSLALDLPPRATVIMLINFFDVIHFYRDDIGILDIRNSSTLPIVYSPNYGYDIIGIKYETRMREMGYSKKNEKGFKGIRLDTWKKN